MSHSSLALHRPTYDYSHPSTPVSLPLLTYKSALFTIVALTSPSSASTVYHHSSALTSLISHPFQKQHRIEDESTHVNQLPRLRTRDIPVTDRVADDRDIVAQFSTDSRGCGDADVSLYIRTISAISRTRYRQVGPVIPYTLR